MRPLSALDLLSIWEAGFAQAPTERALTVLAVACPETSHDALAALSIGQRDAKLLLLREALWGPCMEAVVVCPGCRQRLELPLNTRQVLSFSPITELGEIHLSAAGYEITLRVPTSLDVIAVEDQLDAERCRSFILERCLDSVLKEGALVDSDTLPQEVMESVLTRMAEADPLADIQLNLNCPFCEHRWQALFDIASFLWAEIETWAWRILSEVHMLASAYGWREQDILSLSPTRRQFYLEMVGHE